MSRKSVVIGMPTNHSDAKVMILSPDPPSKIAFSAKSLPNLSHKSLVFGKLMNSGSGDFLQTNSGGGNIQSFKLQPRR
ncbi:hypothetical protein L484_011194 [Morus notabilis]|uniref:Uncharacterized protein n=1 Tax=Morus notabilis TaxID=981085 RepID=W9SAM4_9ROSA|nr:hypothetical protein L484_011194 [Morus notabilis]